MALLMPFAFGIFSSAKTSSSANTTSQDTLATTTATNANPRPNDFSRFLPTRAPVSSDSTDPSAELKQPPATATLSSPMTDRSTTVEPSSVRLQQSVPSTVLPGFDFSAFQALWRSRNLAPEISLPPTSASTDTTVGTVRITNEDELEDTTNEAGSDCEVEEDMLSVRPILSVFDS